MIRCIAALDTRRGIADSHGIPWSGKLPADMRWFRKHTLGQTVLMGRATYENIGAALSDRRNVVVTSGPELPDAAVVRDVGKFLEHEDDVWVLGGQRLFESVLGRADELYLTRVEGDFGCTKFFPAYEGAFERTYVSGSLTENGITFRFEIWCRKAS